MAKPRADRRRPGRRAAGAPRARLSGRLQPVAGAVAQGAARPVRRPRAIAGAAHDRRARGGDRSLHRPRVLEHRGRVRASVAGVHRQADQARRQEVRAVHHHRRRHRRGGARCASCRPRRARCTSPTWPARNASAVRRRRSPPPRCSRKPSRKLGFTTSRTMRVAQKLYEGVAIGDEGTVGLISYMRTDSVNLSAEALGEIARRDRARLRHRGGARQAECLPDQVQERAGSARSDPPDLRAAHAGAGGAVSWTTTSAACTN